MKASQSDKILKHLKTGAPLTPIDALTKFGCFRLAARIKDLREIGYRINTHSIVKNGKKFASYRMAVRK
jgi:hypothetical protein